MRSDVGPSILQRVTTLDDRTRAVEQVPAVAALFIPPANADHLMTAVWSLTSAGIDVVAGGPSGEALVPFREMGCECLVAGNAADLINKTWMLHHLPVLAVGDAVSLPENFLGRALQLMADDLRVATVSFLSNDAGFLSFPVRNEPTNQPPEGHDATSVSRRLRELGPHERPTPIPTAIGAAVLLAPSALGAVGGAIGGPRAELASTLADFSVRARSRGFVHLVDDSTFFLRHRAAGDAPRGSVRSMTSTSTIGIGFTRTTPTRWNSSIMKRDPPRLLWRLRMAWRAPRCWDCGSSSTGPTSGHLKWARRSRSWPAWRR